MNPEEKLEIAKISILNFEIEDGIVIGDFLTTEDQREELKQTLMLLAHKLEL